MGRRANAAGQWQPLQEMTAAPASVPCLSRQTLRQNTGFLLGLLDSASVQLHRSGRVGDNISLET